MKRVLLVTDYFRPEPGGLEALFTGIARHWSGNIEVLVTSNKSHYMCTEDDRHRFDTGEDYPVHRVGPINTRRWFLRGRSRLVEQFRSAVERTQPEHILFGDFQSTRFLGSTAESLGLPYSLFLNGSDLKNRLGFFQFTDRRLALGARNVFTISRYIARGARGFGVREDRIVVIPPGFEPRWPRSKRESVPDFLEQRIKRKTILLGLGPFVPRKGLDVAIESLAMVRDLAPRLHMVLVGSGPEFPYLQELIRVRQLEQMVTLTGFLQDRMLATIMQRAHVLIQPGCEREDDVESLGTVFMEAAWFGMPVLAGRIGGVEEIVRHGVSGFVVEPGNVSELSDRIRQMTESEKLRQRFGKNARDIARRDFDMARTCSAIEMRI
ncbi:MAG: glycosyltransferase family 4 protein [Leptospiraceae bacterium]|nr:glycosyltransferase family 4 protein [Leptospiraceae bacterium]